MLRTASVTDSEPTHTMSSKPAACVALMKRLASAAGQKRTTTSAPLRPGGSEHSEVALVGLTRERFHVRGAVGVLGVHGGDALRLEQVLDEVCECKVLPRVGGRCASEEGVGRAVGERGARRRRRELRYLVLREVFGGGHRRVTARGADDCVSTEPREGGPRKLVCADERASFVARAVFDGEPEARGAGDDSGGKNGCVVRVRVSKGAWQSFATWQSPDRGVRKYIGGVVDLLHRHHESQEPPSVVVDRVGLVVLEQAAEPDL
eukprot:scaffold135049_cov69-Phaeocystis_antarctica.AAC.1